MSLLVSRTKKRPNKAIKRIAFNDNIKIIGVSEPDIEKESRVITHLDQTDEYEVPPKKLFCTDSNISQATEVTKSLQTTFYFTITTKATLIRNSVGG